MARTGKKPPDRHERTKLLFVPSTLARIRKIVLAINAKNRLATIRRERSAPRKRSLGYVEGVTKKNGEMGMAEIFHRVWPSAALAVGLGVTAGWIGLWAFALFKLGELAF